MQKLGQAGWELFQVTDNRLFFKRPDPSGERVNTLVCSHERGNRIGERRCGPALCDTAFA